MSGLKLARMLATVVAPPSFFSRRRLRNAPGVRFNHGGVPLPSPTRARSVSGRNLVCQLGRIPSPNLQCHQR